MANLGNDITLVPAGTVVSANGSSPALQLDNKGVARLALVVSAVSGTTPSLTVTIETSYDAGVTDSWRTVAAFAAKTAAGTERKSFAGLDRFVRATYAITGTTPTETISITGEAV